MLDYVGWNRSPLTFESADETRNDWRASHPTRSFTSVDISEWERTNLVKC